MRIALCNEVLRELPFDRQVDLAARLGYDGLELAPFTLGAEPHRLPAAERRRLQRVIADAGLQVIGLHWLLVAPAGLSTSSHSWLNRFWKKPVPHWVGVLVQVTSRPLVMVSPPLPVP